MKVLIVDDDADDRLLLREYLQAYNFEVTEAINGEDGIAKALATKPGLILSDVLMPRMDGLQLLRNIKRNATLCDVHVILYTAKFTREDEQRFAESLGACAYIVRPDTVGEFHARLRAEIDKLSCSPDTFSKSSVNDEDFYAAHSSIITDKLHEKMRELTAASDNHREAEEFARDILESIGEGFAVIGPDYKIIMANTGFGSHLQKHPEEIKGCCCYEISHQLNKPCSQEGQECPLEETFKTGVSHTVLHTHQDSEGRPMYVEIKSYPMRDAAGNITSVIETVNDVTEKRKLEDQLRQAQKMESVGHLAGGVAHDFNNFLTAIIGYGNLLELSIPEESPLRQYTHAILAAGERAAHLTQSLLSFSRKQTSNPTPVDLNEIITVIGKLLLKLVGEDIKTNISLSDTRLYVMADSGQIGQVLMNLATNARDAMANRGVLTITTECIHLSKEFVHAHGYGESGLYALLTVTDTGSGMTEEVREHIFEPLFTTKEAGRGTGLGLSIVYGIIKQHRGYINVYSEESKGTTFKVYLPLLQSEIEQEKIQVLSELQGGSETILIAEDDDNVRQIMRDILEGYGYRVIEAEDGKEAVTLFTRNADQIKLLLFDVMMPGESGWEAYQEIRAVRPEVAILFMSGYPIDFIQAKGIPSTKENYLAKPVSPEELLRKVRAALDKRKEAEA
jgi:two-component system cell cycle sensor histidine kinase/response regulator CckA